MRITIVIPAYNAEKYLPTALDSCISQTYKDIEVLVVNDGSTDTTVDIISRYSEQYPFVKSVFQQNRGLVEARKTGARATETEYMMFLDADDYLEPDAVERLVEGYDRSQADFIFSNFYTEKEDGTLLFLSNNKFEEGLAPESVLKAVLRKKVFPPIWGRLMKTELFRNTDTLSNLTLGEDAAALFQIIYLQPTISYVDSYTLHYIQRGGSMVHKKSTKLQTQRLLLINWVLDYVSTHFYYDGIEDDLNIFILSELFTYLRDGGDFSLIKHLYENIIIKKGVMKYTSYIGRKRCIMLYLFSKSKVLGNMYLSIYNGIRGLSYKTKHLG